VSTDNPTPRRASGGLDQFDELFLPSEPAVPEKELTFEERAIGEVVNPLEQINSVFKRTASRVWLGVGGLALLVAAFIVWGCVAQQVVTTKAQVELLPTSGLYPVAALAAGVVQEISVSQGATVHQGDKVGVIGVPGAQPVTLTAPVDGTIVSVDAANGQVIAAGATFMQMARTGDPSVAVGLLSPAEVGTAVRGQKVTIALPSINPTRYGRLTGTIDYIGDAPISQGRVIALFGNTPVASSILQGGPAYEVRITLGTDSTPSGYHWTVGKGPDQRLPMLTSGLAFIEVSRRSLASRAFGG
jgi:hypothetical protein